MNILTIDQIDNNPRTACTIVFGSDVNKRAVLLSFKDTIKLKENSGLIDKKDGIAMLKQAELKLNGLNA